MATTVGEWQTIDLARSPPFRIGVLEVSPATRELKSGSIRTPLEPRVMQVLVALHQRLGEIVGHQELIARCWNGQVVGDNAIRRVISRLREVAATAADGSFSIDTVAKVGYRLVNRDETFADAAPTSRSIGGVSETARAAADLGWIKRRRWWLVLGSAAALIAGALGYVASRDAPPRALRIVVANSGEPASAALSSQIGLTVAQFATARPGHPVVVLPAGSSEPFDHRVEASVTRAPGLVRAQLSLMAQRGRPALWTATIEREGADSTALVQEASAAFAPVLTCLAAPGVRAERLDADTLRQFLSACQRMPEMPDETVANLLRAVVERRPSFTLARAELAYAEAYLSYPGLASSPPEGERLRHTARRNLDAARAEAPGLAALYLAEAALTPRTDWRRQLQLLEEGVRAAPDDPRLHAEYSRALSTVGRMGQSLTSARRAVELDPHAPRLRGALISSLAYIGYADAARAELEVAQRTWPASRSLQDVAFRFHLRFGDPTIAMRMIESGQGGRRGPADREWAQTLAFVQARLDPTPANVDRAVRAHGDLSPTEAPFWQLQTLGLFGPTDAAIDLLLDPRRVPMLQTGPEVLFRQHLRAVRQDPRFMTVMARLGLVRFWRDSGHWPDFCNDPELRYDCRVEAGRVSSATLPP